MTQAEWDKYDAEWQAEFNAERERNWAKLKELQNRREQLDEMSGNIFPDDEGGTEGGPYNRHPKYPPGRLS